MVEDSKEKLIGKKIQTRRKEAGMTQEELAMEAKVSYTTLTKIESGKIKSPSLNIVSKLAAALDLSLDDFNSFAVFEGEGVLKKIHADILATLKSGDTMFISGIDEKLFLKFESAQIKAFLADLKENNLFQKLLCCEGDSVKFKEKFIEYRSIPKEFFNPTPIYCYANKIAMLIWGPPQRALILDNSHLAETFKKQFLFMWQSAKTT